MSRHGAERWWREGILLGLFGAGQGANNCTIGRGKDVERAIKLSPEKLDWDVELLFLSVKGLPRTFQERI